MKSVFLEVDLRLTIEVYVPFMNSIFLEVDVRLTMSDYGIHTKFGVSASRNV